MAGDNDENNLCLLTGFLEERNDNDGGHSWSYIVRHLSHNVRERREVKKKINANMYEDYLLTSDPLRETMNKKNIHFVVNNLNHDVEIFEHKGETITLLKMGSDIVGKTTNAKFPEFMNVGEDVSENPLYFNHNISLKSNA